MTPMNESLLKTDNIGRLRYTSEQKKILVDAYRASGLSAPRFAAHHGVPYQTLISWIKKAKNFSASTAPDCPLPKLFPLIPAVIERVGNPSSDGAMEVLLPSGTRIHITSPGQIDLAVALIRELNNSRPC